MTIVIELAKGASGIAGGVFALLALKVLIDDVKAGKFKLHRWTWAIFLVGAIGGAIYAVEGHAGVTGTVFPVILALALAKVFSLTRQKRYRQKGVERWYHPYGVIGAIVLYTLQLTLHQSPLWGALVAIVVDFLALHIQWENAWKFPHDQTVKPWAYGTVGGLFGLLALSEWTWTGAAYPVYFLFTNLVVVGILMYQQPRVPLPTAAGA